MTNFSGVSMHKHADCNTVTAFQSISPIMVLYQNNCTYHQNFSTIW